MSSFVEGALPLSYRRRDFGTPLPLHHPSGQHAPFSGQSPEVPKVCSTRDSPVCSPGRTRTSNLPINSRLLCQLSYERMSRRRAPGSCYRRLSPESNGPRSDQPRARVAINETLRLAAGKSVVVGGQEVRRGTSNRDRCKLAQPWQTPFKRGRLVRTAPALAGPASRSGSGGTARPVITGWPRTDPGATQTSSCPAGWKGISPRTPCTGTTFRLGCVGMAGLEPAASSSRTKRATKLLHIPMPARIPVRSRPVCTHRGCDTSVFPGCLTPWTGGSPPQAGPDWDQRCAPRRS